MESMEILEGDYVKIEFLVPTRGLLGYRSEFINATRGEGTLLSSFERFDDYKVAFRVLMHQYLWL